MNDESGRLPRAVATREPEERRMKNLLRAVQRADDQGSPADNESIAVSLGWNLEETAVLLQAARDQMLVWGQREGRKPGPWYSALEITVQGRRFLRPTAS